MIDQVLSIVLSLILIALAVIHFNWVFGGKFGFIASLPTTKTGKRVLNPKKIHSAIVGIGLAFFALYYVLISVVTYSIFPNWLVGFLGWIIPSIFILRAIGDFKYIGFFKHIKQTEFARRDAKYFSPLCLLIGLLGMIIQFYK